MHIKDCVHYFHREINILSYIPTRNQWLGATSGMHQRFEVNQHMTGIEKP